MSNINDNGIALLMDKLAENNSYFYTQIMQII